MRSRSGFFAAAVLGSAAAFGGCGGGGGTGGSAGSGGSGASATGTTSTTSTTDTGSTTTTTTTSATGTGGTTGTTTSTTGVCTPGATEACYGGPSGTQGVGLCKAGTKTCDADGMAWGACVGEVTPKNEDCLTPEDDDCNGTANEGCACTPGQQQPCYSGPTGTEGVGICAAGVQTCKPDASGYGACVGEVLPATENCMVAGDEDCDGNALQCTGTTSWARRAGDNKTQTGNGVAFTAQRGAVVIGTFTGAMDFSATVKVAATNPTNATDVFVVSYDAAGTPLWAKQFGQDVTSQTGSAVAADPSGNILITGDFTGFIGFGPGSSALTSTLAATTDVFVAKLDVLGNHIWSKKAGDGRPQSGKVLAVDDAGNVIVGGTFAGPDATNNGAIDFGCAGGPLLPQGLTDIFLAKLDPSGACMWQKGFGSPSKTQAINGVAVDAQGNVAITGALIGNVDFGGGALTNANVSVTDVFVAKFSPTGAHLWSKRFGDGSAQTGTGLGFDGAGNLYVTGDLAGNINFGGGQLTSAGGTDVFIAKLDPAGGFLWANRWGDGNNQNAKGISVDPNGNIVLLGDLGGTINFVISGTPQNLTSAGGMDLFVAKLDSLGNHIWSHRFGDAYNQNGAAVVAGATHVFLTGSFLGTLDFGNGNMLSSGGGSDFFLARLEP